MKKTNTWKSGSLIPKELKEAASAIGAEVRAGGVALEVTLIKDLKRMLNAYPGWDIIDGKQIKKHPEILKQVGKPKGNETVIPDIDTVLINPIGKVVLVISSKGSIQDDKVYSSIYHHNYFKEKGIGFWVVTKDTKSTFKTGDTKYFAFIPPTMKIFINNEDTYNEAVNHNFEDWNFNHVVRPYFEIFVHFTEIINNYNNSKNKLFFTFEQKNCKNN